MTKILVLYYSMYGHVETLAQAVAAGARYGIVHGARSSQPVGPGNYAALQKVVVNNAIGLDPAMLVVKVSWENESNVPGNRITVEAVYRTRGVTGLFWPGQTFALYSSSSMIIQN